VPPSPTSSEPFSSRAASLANDAGRVSPVRVGASAASAHASERREGPTLGRRNLFAGIAGYGWTAALQLISTPILLKLLGPESFGLVGFYMAVQGASQVFDLGLSPTINREMARATVEQRAEEARDFLRTIEPGYWAVGVVLGLLVALLAPMLASHWVRVSASGLSASAIRLDVALIALLIAVQWPITLYEGALTGLHRIAALHAVGIVMRSAGVACGLAVLFFGPRELAGYLLSLAAFSLLHVLLLARLLRRSLPVASRPARWSPAVVYRVWRFAAGMSVLMLLSAILINADRLLLSRLLALGAFGYYTLAHLVGASLYVLVLPVFHSVFPVLAGRVAAGDERGERETYHLGAQSLTVLVIPAAAVIALFMPDLLLAWTGNPETARQAAPIARLLVIGTAVNAQMTLPYVLQLAHGRTKIGIVTHIGLIALFLPAIIVATTRYGAIGAASVWIGLNLLYLLVGVPVTHHLLMRGEVASWLFGDVIAPSAAGLPVAVLGWLLSSRLSLPPYLAVAAALSTLALAWVAAALAAARVRRWILPSVARWLPRRTGVHP
jgi:O-antigen/teichoic acid export membrane protein